MNRSRGVWHRWQVAFLLMCVVGGVSTVQADTLLDDFETIDGWSVNFSDHARAEIASDEGKQGKALRLDFEIEPGGSFVLIRKAFPNLTLPKSYALKFWLRAEAPPNDFQIKLIDRANKNVWWYNQRAFTFPTEWRHVLVKDPRVQFAWGPAGGGQPRDVGFIEFAVGATTGGKGSIWIDELVLEARPISSGPPPPPKVDASTSLPGQGPERVLDLDRNTMWHSGSLVAQQWLQVDFQKRREYGGIVLDWDTLDYAVAYRVLSSDDGENWSTLYQSSHGNGGRDYIYTPDAESRYLRLELDQSSRGQGYGLCSLSILPYEMVASPNQFFETIAKDAAPGTYPKYFSGQQVYWTEVNGIDDGPVAIFSSDGILEPHAGGFSLEPFVFVGGSLVGWSQVNSTPSLEQGDLPIPTVTWRHERFSLDTTVVAGGRDDGHALFVRYRLTNSLEEPQDITLYLALRTFQVLPPWQNLNIVGGVTQIRDLVFDARTVWVNDSPALVSQTPPDRFGAATYEEGSVTEFMLSRKLPPGLQVSDPYGHASGALEYALHLGPHASADIYVALPLRQQYVTSLQLGMEGAAAEFHRQMERSVQLWRTVLGRVELQLPTEADAMLQSLRMAVAHLLMSRNGAALQPGPRTYARAWIRDAASMVHALLQMGFIEEPGRFLRWFADFQQPDGRMVCCVDQRGPDLVPENDSNGEFIFSVAEYFRYTRDIGTLTDLWPAVTRAADWIITARESRMTDAYKSPRRRGMFGLLPESISHEGYAGHPVHSYWDDFWALRGLKDATDLAVVMGEDERAARLAQVRDEFRRDLVASLNYTITSHKLDFIPGSVELADFDANSTAIAISPVGEFSSLPRKALKQTFERYYEILQQRLQGNTQWDTYTPYELRNVQVFLALGDRRRAWEILDANLRDQRPAAWRQWPEVIWRDPTLPRFIGDMPHGWISAMFIEAVRSLFAHEGDDGSLILAAGVQPEWVNGQGVRIKRMPTHFGVLNYTLSVTGPNSMTFKVGGDLTVPSAGIVLAPPLPGPIKALQVNGRLVDPPSGMTLTVHELPVEVIIEF